jgi:hypothetical protein
MSTAASKVHGKAAIAGAPTVGVPHAGNESPPAFRRRQVEAPVMDSGLYIGNETAHELPSNDD